MAQAGCRPALSPLEGSVLPTKLHCPGPSQEAGVTSRFQNHVCVFMGQGEVSESGLGTKSTGRRWGLEGGAVSPKHQL